MPPEHQLCAPRRLLQLLVSALVVLPLAPVRAQDPLADDLQRLDHFLTTTESRDENFAQIQPTAAKEVTQAIAAQQQGHRLLALYKLARIRGNVRGIEFQLGAAADGALDMARLDREWEERDRDFAPPTDGELAEIHNAALRALAEASAPQVRGLYLASRDFGHATTAAAGLFYLGAAQAEREFVALLRRLPDAAAGRELQIPPLAAAIDALNRDLLAAYVPPLAFDRHGEFVAAHSALVDARELDAAGRRHGALLRYLQAAVRSAALRSVAATPRDRIEADLAAARKRIAAEGRDDSIAAMLLELAASELAAAAADQPTPIALAMARDGLPRYFAAIPPRDAGPATASTPIAAPERAALTVTLVRWPYT